MVYSNASLEGRTALIPPIMGFGVVKSIELPCYYLFLPSWAIFFKITNDEIYTYSHEFKPWEKVVIEWHWLSCKAKAAPDCENLCKLES